MTADERAAKLWEDLDMMYDTDDGIEGEKRDIARIAAAIRAAAAEAYERAAKVAEVVARRERRQMVFDGPPEGTAQVAEDIAAKIRELE